MADKIKNIMVLQGGADIDRSLTGRCHRGGSFFNGP